MNPVVVFDLGKVLVDFDYSIAARKIAARCANRLAGMNGVASKHPQLAATFSLANDDTSRRLKALIPDPLARKRLFDRFQMLHPAETSKQIYDRIIDEIERDRR